MVRPLRPPRQQDARRHRAASLRLDPRVLRYPDLPSSLSRGTGRHVPQGCGGGRRPGMHRPQQPVDHSRVRSSGPAAGSHPGGGPAVERGCGRGREWRPVGEPVRFDPCAGCDAPCLRACPRGAFADLIYDPLAPGLEELRGRLPGKTGHFSRAACTVQMEADIANAAEWPIAQAPGADSGRPGAAAGDAVKVIRYCRACELSCPVGSPANLDRC